MYTLCRGWEQEIWAVKNSDPDTEDSAHVPLLGLHRVCTAMGLALGGKVSGKGFLKIPGSQKYSHPGHEADS